MFQVLITDKRIQNAYQNVLEGRPSATDTVLTTTSMREAVEFARNKSTKLKDFEYITVKDGDGYVLNTVMALNAINQWVWVVTYVNGKRVDSGRVEFEKMGKIDTPSEISEAYNRMDRYYWADMSGEVK